MEQIGALIEHGPARYMHDENKTLSYYALLQGENGALIERWGIDIERSLEAAGAEIGDSVALTRGGEEPVKIQEKQKDGTFVEKTVMRITWETQIHQDEMELRAAPELVKEQSEIARPIDAAIAGEKPDSRFAVTAPYWVNGLHNKEGMALAEEINKLVSSKKLEEEKEAIEELLKTYNQVKLLGLSVVPEKQHLEDPHRKMNLAEPSFLLDGAFVREKGEYRPKDGGRAVVVDKGDSLLLKNKDAKSYEAAVELAKAKGWTAISLKGRPAMMESAWIAAQLAGIEVINYEPTKEAKAKFAERLAERQANAEMHRAAAQCVSTGVHDGKIIAIEGGQAVQKIGRDPDVTVRHDISKLSRVPAVGEAAYIVYDKSGRGILKERAQEKALGR